MVEILSRAGGFALIIVIGIILRSRGAFKDGDFSVLSNVIVRVTLPCAIITNFNRFSLDFNLFSIFFIAIIMNLLMAFLGYFVAFKKSGEEKAFNIINYSGYNIGSFTIPFVQNFLGPSGLMAACLFDAGNAIMCTGANYSFAAAVSTSVEEKVKFKTVVKNIFSSNTVLASLAMILLAAFNLKLPDIFLQLASIAGEANGFLAMFVIGLSFRVDFDKEKMKRLGLMIIVRYLAGFILAYLFLNYAPFPIDVRIGLAFICFSPISSVSVPFTEKIKGDVSFASTIISVNIILSIISMTIFLLIL